MAAVMVYAERKVAAFMQQRYGPYLVGPKGLLQPVADILKLFFKEELRPKAADAFLFSLAPIISVTAAYLAFAPVPFGAPTTFFGLLDEPIELQVSDVNVAVLVIFAVASMGVYGIVLAGWASNSKYSLLGGLRSSAQMISYELAYGMSLATVVMMAGSMSLREIVDQQAGYWFGFIPKWYIFLQPIALLRVRVRGRGGNQSRAVRLPGSRAGAGRRLSHRIQLDALRHVLHGGVHQHGHGLGGRREPVPRRLARPVHPARIRLDLVRDQAGVPVVRLPVAALDAAAIPLRPADVVRVEGAVAAGDGQPAAHRRGGALLWALTRCSFTCSRPSRWSARCWW